MTFIFSVKKGIGRIIYRQENFCRLYRPLSDNEDVRFECSSSKGRFKEIDKRNVSYTLSWVTEGKRDRARDEYPGGLLPVWGGVKELLPRGNRKIYIQSYSKCFLTQSPTVLQLRKSYDIGVVDSVRGIHIRRGLIDENLGRAYSRGEKQSGTCSRAYVYRVCCVFASCETTVRDSGIDYWLWYISIWNISLSLSLSLLLSFSLFPLFLYPFDEYYCIDNITRFSHCCRVMLIQWLINTVGKVWYLCNLEADMKFPTMLLDRVSPVEISTYLYLIFECTIFIIILGFIIIVSNCSI